MRSLCCVVPAVGQCGCDRAAFEAGGRACCVPLPMFAVLTWDCWGREVSTGDEEVRGRNWSLRKERVCCALSRKPRSAGCTGAHVEHQHHQLQAQVTNTGTPIGIAYLNSARGIRVHQCDHKFLSGCWSRSLTPAITTPTDHTAPSPAPSSCLVPQRTRPTISKANNPLTRR